jgi:hypothetical protein
MATKNKSAAASQGTSGCLSLKQENSVAAQRHEGRNGDIGTSPRSITLSPRLSVDRC